VGTLALRSPDLELKLVFVGQAPLFRGLSADRRLEIASRARDRRLRRREILSREGEAVRETSLLGLGRLKITQLAASGQEVLIRLIGPGEVCGGLGVPVGGLHPTSAEALESSHALVWEQRVMSDLLDSFPVLGRNALRIQSERLRMLEERYRELATERVPPRLARTLVRLVGHVGSPCEGGVRVALSREELAQMVGTTLFTVSRLLSEWESHGLVRGARKAVVVRDLSGLAAFADGPAASEVRP
jgi:CRP-like cAMP-binding protein